MQIRIKLSLNQPKTLKFIISRPYMVAWQKTLCVYAIWSPNRYIIHLWLYAKHRNESIFVSCIFCGLILNVRDNYLTNNKYLNKISITYVWKIFLCVSYFPSSLSILHVWLNGNQNLNLCLIFVGTNYFS